MWKFVLILLGVMGVSGGVAYWQIGKAKAEIAELRLQNNGLKREAGLAETKIAKKNVLLKSISKEAEELRRALKAEVIAHGIAKAELNARGGGKTTTRIKYRDRIVGNPLPGKPLPCSKEGEITSLPYRYSDFRIDIEGDAVKQVLEYQLHQRFRLELTEFEKRDGAIETQVVLQEETDGKPLRLELESFSMLRKSHEQESVDWFNPKLDISAAYSLTDQAPIADLGVSLSTHGRTEDDIRWRFFRIGVASNSKDYALTFSPAQYNIGKHIPLLDNVWVQPIGGKYLTGAKDWLVGLGIGGTL